MQMHVRLLILVLSLSLAATAFAGEIHDAVDSGQVSLVKSLLQQDSDLLNARNDAGLTPVNLAAYRGHLDIVTMLLDMGADMTIGDTENSLPMHNAAVAGQTDVIDLLFDRGADINAQDDNLMTPLMFALSRSHRDVALFLLDAGADVTRKSNSDVTALHYAALRGFADIAVRLIDMGADLEARDDEGNTALIFAALRNQIETADTLIARGANLEASDDYKRTALLLVARETGNVDMAKLLLDRGAEINPRDKFGDTPLTLAAWRGFAAIANLLLDRGADVPVTGKKGYELIADATNRGLVRLFQEMVKRGADPKTATTDGGTLLHNAAKGGSVEITQMLIDEGVNIDGADRYGWTALHYAADYGRLDAVRLLLSSGADINVRTLSGMSALNLAQEKNRSDVVETLTVGGADQSPQKFPQLRGPYLGQKPPGEEPQLFAPDMVATSFGSHGSISFSPDGTEAFFTRYIHTSDSGYMHGKILTSRIENGAWTAPKLAFFCHDLSYGDDVPFFSPDGNRVFFLSRRPTREGGRIAGENLWYIERTDGGWSEPILMSSAVNSVPLHWQHSVAANGAIYYATGAPGGHGRGDLYRCSLTDSGYAPPVNLGDVLNTEHGEMMPCIAPDESYMVFVAGGYADSVGMDDIYISFKDADGGWTKPKNIGEPINTDATELCPIVSPDGKYLFYIGSRNGVRGVYWVEAGFIDRLRP